MNFVLEKAVILKYRVVYLSTKPPFHHEDMLLGAVVIHTIEVWLFCRPCYSIIQKTHVHVFMSYYTNSTIAVQLQWYGRVMMYFSESGINAGFYNKIKVILRTVAKTNLRVSFEAFLSRHRKPEETRRGIIQLWVGLEWLTRMLHRVTARVVASFWGPGLDLLPLKVTRPLQGMF